MLSHFHNLKKKEEKEKVARKLKPEAIVHKPEVIAGALQALSASSVKALGLVQGLGGSLSVAPVGSESATSECQVTTRGARACTGV